MTTFTLNNTDYRCTNKGYYYAQDLSTEKEVRIKKSEFQEAYEAYKEIEEREEALLSAQEDMEAIERGENTNPTPKAKKKHKRASKKAFFSIEVDGTTIGLTEKQTIFIETMPEDGFYDKGLDSQLWIDTFCVTLADTMNAMAVGAVISTLREKGIIFVDRKRTDGRLSTFFGLTATGKMVAKALGLH